MQNFQAIFFDTETSIQQIDSKTEKQTLKLGTGIHWIRDLDYKDCFDFYDTKVFWDKVEDIALNSKHLFLLAHNTDFDFKVVNGYEELFIKRGWTMDSFYIEGTTYIIRCHKDKHKLDIIDSMNHFSGTLKQLGKSLNIPKLEIDFKTCSTEELLTYCRRDTEIVYEAFKELLNFLESNDLSKFKNTI